MARLVISLLGPFHVTLDGAPVTGFESAKVRALLAYLAAEIDRPHPREALAELLWPDQPAVSSLGSLRHALANLRSLLQDRAADPPLLLVTTDSLRLNPAANICVDLAQFNLLAGLDRPCALDECRQAADLARGGFLQDFTVDGSPQFDEWATVLREQVDRRLVRLLARLVRHSVEHGDHAHALSWTRRQLSLQPWNEEVHRQLIWLLAVSGQRAAALRQADICRRTLAAELDVDPSQETETLVDRIRSDDRDLGQVRGQDGEILLPSPARPRHNLPVVAAPFFGREAELALIGTHLADPRCRLLTIVGPGGVGKTRLALEAAARQVDRFADGVFVVFLAAVVQAELLAGEILRTLDVAASGAADPEQRLRDFLSGKEMLLVLDNFEQLTVRSPFLADLLVAAPKLKILVTARERLHLSIEWLVPLDGLDVPALAEAPGIQETAPSHVVLASLDSYSAVELFVHAARRVQPTFALTPVTGPAIVRVCRLLDGFPLALELAAAWVRLLPLEEVLAELERSSDLLSTTLTDVPERHRSMDAVFDHSWNLLTPREQGLLRQLAVFRGGFNRAAAQEVANATVADLAALVDKSWLRVSVGGRYGMHELVRQYCEARLDAEHETAAHEPPSEVRRRHCSYIASVMRDALQKLNFQRDTYDEIVPELGNLQAAWRYAVENVDSEAGKQIALGIWFSGDVLGWFNFALQTLELGAVALEEKIARAGHDSAAAHRAALILVWIRLGQSDQNSHLSLYEKNGMSLAQLACAIDSLEPCDAKTFWKAELALRYTWQALHDGDFDEIRNLAQRSLRLFEDPRFVDQLYGTQAGTVFWKAQIHMLLGLAAMHLGDYDTARREFRQDYELSDSIGEGRFKGHHLFWHSRQAVIVGDYRRARELAGEGLGLEQRFSDLFGIARLHVASGYAAAAAGQDVEASMHFHQGLELATQCGALWFRVEAFAGLGRLALAQGSAREARRCFEEAMHATAQSGAQLVITVAALRIGLGWTALAEGGLDEARDAFTRVLRAERGRAAWETMDAIAGLARVLQQEGAVEQAVELLAMVAEHRFTAYALRQQATQWLGEREAGMPPEVYAARLAAGRARDLDTTLASLRA